MTSARRTPTTVAPPLHLTAFTALAALMALAATNCKAAGADVGLSKDADQKPIDVPVPAADGPKLVAARPRVPVLQRPEPGSPQLGELSVGALVARSPEPYSRKGCAAGWYAVRPRGFVCASDGATLRVELAPLLPAAPDLARPLPYRYGRARTQGTPAYPFLPDAAAIGDAEPDLSRHLAKAPERADALLGASANDVPLDDRGVPTGPPILLPTGDGIGDDGKRTEASFFTFAAAAARHTAPLVPLPLLGGDLGPKPVALRKGSGVAVTRSVTAPGPGEGEARRFGVTPDGRLVPTDRLQAALGATWHGVDLDKVGLPLAFVHRYDVHTFHLARGKATETDEEIERHAPVPLTGRFRTVDAVRYEEARDGYWLRAEDLLVIVKRTKLPEFAKGTQRWLDISLANQTLTAYEGPKPVYATLIASGRDQLQDPATTASTARGVFRIRSKHVTRAIDPREVQESFDVADAPWVMEFEPGFALTGMYWSDAVGEPRTFHDVALAPIDARRLFAWTEPALPEGWHAVTSGEGEGTIVNVRP